MQLDLTLQEAKLLRAQLGYRIEELDRGLVRTDQFTLQHALAREIEVLRDIEKRLARGLALEDRPEDVFV
jgi:hypothetical protein